MDVEERKYLEARTDKLIPIMDENGKFYEDNVQAIHKIRNKHHDMVDHLGVINSMVEFLKDQEMLPAIFFVFSRNKCEQYAEMLHHTLNSELEQHEAEKTIDYYISKLENKESYQKLAQFQRIKKLLMRGIGFHHSGLVPIFKEITEILFSKYLLKILFVTETFSVGINLPTKAVVFTGLVKYDSGNKFRILKTFEYRQMSGRAGRRGMDTVGYVIHLPNIGDYPTVGEVRQMMLGNPPPIVSKFSLNYQFVLKAILTESLDQIIRASLWNREIDEKLGNLKQQVTNEDNNTMAKKEIEDCKLYESLQNDVMIDGIKLSQNIIKANRKRAQKMMTSAKFKQTYSLYKTMDKEIEKKQEIKSDIENMEKYITVELDRILSMLKEFEYIKDDKVTIKGMMASKINQVNPLLLTEMVYKKIFDRLQPEEIVGILAIFTDCKNIGTEINIPTEKMKVAIDIVEKIGEELWKAEEKLGIRLDSEWEISRTLVGVAYNWVKNNEMPSSNTIFEGEFIKEMISINHICGELEILFDIIQDNELKIIVSDIKSRLMREIVCCDSLYIMGNK
jgi:superfamily II RNA helicase